MLKADLSHRYSVKAEKERVLGRKAWRELKETTSVEVWRKTLVRVLQAIDLAVQATVTVCDFDHLDKLHRNLDEGIQ